MKPDGSTTGLWEAFSHAAQGVAVVARGRNFRIQASVGGIAVVLGVAFGIDIIEWCIVFACISLVLGLECANTAIEQAIDLACPEVDPRAKVGKDAAAGAVLVASIGALAVGVAMFLPRIVGVLFA